MNNINDNLMLHVVHLYNKVHKNLQNCKNIKYNNKKKIQGEKAFRCQTCCVVF